MNQERKGILEFFAKAVNPLIANLPVPTSMKLALLVEERRQKDLAKSGLNPQKSVLPEKKLNQPDKKPQLVLKYPSIEAAEKYGDYDAVRRMEKERMIDAAGHRNDED